MSRKLSNLVGAAILSASLLLSSGPILAQGQAPGNTPSQPAAVPSDFVTINPGQQLWYAFQFGGGDAEVTIDMHVEPHNTASFAVWSPDRLSAFFGGDDANDDDEPLGRGTVLRTGGAEESEEVRDPGDLLWKGTLPGPGTYHVMVENPSALPASYTLTIKGDGVSNIVAPSAGSASAAQNQAQGQAQGQMTAAQAGQSQSATAAQAGQAQAAAATARGTSVETALPFPSGFASAARGSRTWYAFQYPGDDAQVVIELHGDPHGSASFAVWTPELLREWAADFATEPIGRGTPNKFVNGDGEDDNTGDLVWNGSFAGPGTYYVMVDQSRNSAGSYSLKLAINPSTD